MSDRPEDAEGAGLRAGAARIDITPEDLTALNPIGGGSFTGVRDRLWARVLVLDDGPTRVALVSTDLIEVGSTVGLRDRIERETGVRSDHLFITASHSHSAPRFGRVSPGALAHDGGPESDRYSERVGDLLVEAIGRAIGGLVPARVAWAVGDADVNVNRDLYVDGRWTLGHNAAGPSDKAVRVMRVSTRDGAVIGLVLNYAVHSVVTLGSGEISGDVAGAAQRHVEDALGGDAVALWTLGSVGDQNPRVQLGFPGTFSPAEIDAAFAASDALGLLIGAEAVRIARAPLWEEPAPVLAARQRAHLLPTKRGIAVMDTMRQEAVDEVELLLSVIRVGGIAFAGVSGEVTTPVAQRLRAASPLAATVLVSMVNDRIGYLPDDEAYDRGTFEANGSPVEQGYGERTIVAGLTQLIAGDR